MESDVVREVSFEEALAEENQHDQAGDDSAAPRPRPAPGGQHIHADGSSNSEHAQAPPPPPSTDSEAQAAAEQVKEDIEILAPPVESKEWTFGEDDAQRTYVQCELSVTGSAQWFSLLGEFLNEAMSGENALSLNSLLSPPTPRQQGQFQLADFQDADMFVHALGKLLMVMPDFLEKSVCIWLDVPDYEWELVRLLMRRSPKRGGMSPETFEGILETFIDQNYAEIDRFFRVRFQRLRARWQARAKEASQSRSSKR